MKQQQFLLICAMLALWHGSLVASNAIDFTSIPLADANTLDKCLYLIQSAGGTVVIDCLENDKMLAKPKVVSVDGNTLIGTPFYQVKFYNNVCVVSPKEEKLRSEFLFRKIPSYALNKTNINDAIFLLGRQAGTVLTLIERRPSHKEINMNVANESVEQILLAIASSLGSRRIVLSAGIDEHGQRTPGVTYVQFQ